MSEYQRFLQDKGELKRYDYDLNEDSFVMDVGGYKGEFAENIFTKFGCYVHIYEPVFFNDIHNKFSEYIKIWLHHYGLSKKSCIQKIAVQADSTSLHKVGEMVEIKLIDINNEFKEFAEDVDLIKINIEGEEYNLLERMIETDIITKFKNIQVQFHSFVPDAENRMNKIKTELSKTHVCEWAYEFIWESWRLK